MDQGKRSQREEQERLRERIRQQKEAMVTTEQWGALEQYAITHYPGYYECPWCNRNPKFAGINVNFSGGDGWD
jgi:hypothetical protein